MCLPSRMGSKLRELSGDDVGSILSRFGFFEHSRKGSHIKLRRTTTTAIETLVVPDHNPISRGTLRAIYTQASRYVAPEDLHPHFFTSEK
jgi:predicted RNA binding protein YcfA (HicA-like mRNA interferase family)